MDYPALLKFVEGQARGYVLHLVSVLGPRAVRHEARGAAAVAPESEGPTAALDPSVFVFGLISLTIGVTLQDIFVSGEAFAKIDFGGRFASQVCFWLLISLVLDFLLNVGRRRVEYARSMSVTLTVLPTVFVVGAYAAFVARGIGTFFPDPTDPNWPQGLAAVMDALVQVVVLARCLPLVLRHEVGEIGWVRRAAVSVAIVAVVAGVDGTTLYGLNMERVVDIGRDLAAPVQPVTGAAPTNTSQGSGK